MSHHACPPAPLAEHRTQPELSVAGIPFASIVATTGALAAATYGSVAAGLPTLCPFRIGTGQACPLCGLSRSLFSMVRGDVDASLRYHPLLVPLAIQIAILGVLRARGVRIASGRRIFWANVAVFGVVWIIRWRLGLLEYVIADNPL